MLATMKTLFLGANARAEEQLRDQYAIELIEQVELAALLGPGNPLVRDVLDQLLDALVLGVDVGALVGAWQEAGLPVLGFLDGIAPGTHRDEAGEVLICRYQPVGDP